MTTPATIKSPGLNKSKMATFFTSAALMDVVEETLVKLKKEGINQAEDLAKYDQEMWKQAVDNLKHLGN
eukprot:12800300-Ditylum_brightwellii.AAC.1